MPRTHEQILLENLCQNCPANRAIEARLSDYDKDCYSNCERGSGRARLESERLEIAKAAGEIGCNLQNIELSDDAVPETIVERMDLSRQCPAYIEFRKGVSDGRQELPA